jgi:hypothetical protein
MFFSRCERTIEILPTLPRSKYDPEDIDANAEDHCSDALGLQYVGGSTFREVWQSQLTLIMLGFDVLGYD